MVKDTDYVALAKADAQDMAREFAGAIVEMLKGSGVASDDLFNDYPGADDYHHLTHVDKAYDLSEASAILDQLSDHEETDEGLWEGLKPREAISAQAAYTYGNAVYSMWRDLVGTINDEAQGGPLADMLGEDDPADDATVRACVLSIIAGE